jgi:hypothetical protein
MTDAISGLRDRLDALHALVAALREAERAQPGLEDAAGTGAAAFRDALAQLEAGRATDAEAEVAQAEAEQARRAADQGALAVAAARAAVGAARAELRSMATAAQAELLASTRSALAALEPGYAAAALQAAQHAATAAALAEIVGAAWPADAMRLPQRLENPAQAVWTATRRDLADAAMVEPLAEAVGVMRRAVAAAA